MRVNSAEVTLQEKGDYERLEATHRTRVYAYRAENGSFTDTLFKEEVQTCGQHISYCSWDLATKTQLLSAGSRN